MRDSVLVTAKTFCISMHSSTSLIYLLTTTLRARGELLDLERCGSEQIAPLSRSQLTDCAGAFIKIKALTYAISLISFCFTAL